MEITSCNIRKYFALIDSKIKKYKKRQIRIWSLHLIYFINTNHIYLSNNNIESFQKEWFKYCMWELKYQPSIKEKLDIYSKNIQKRIQKYKIIISKLSKKYINNDCIIHIVQYII